MQEKRKLVLSGLKQGREIVKTGCCLPQKQVPVTIIVLRKSRFRAPVT